ncbi:MAG: transketolase [Bacteriovoracaceae bacterium]|jgi:transketolase|nr:transketolase [Bacteriovoracaceae bacterium]
MSHKPLSVKCPLAGTPTAKPLYPTSVTNSKGEEILVGDPKMTRGLLALMNMHAVIGGAACHWGGPAALAEIMSACHGLMFHRSKQNWSDDFNFVNDEGHAENGVYALRANLGFDNLSFNDLKGFRSIESKLTGHGEGHLNPEGVLLSNGPLGSSIAQAQGLAFADKLIGNNRVTMMVVSDGASMEGETKEAFAAIPGLASKGKLNPVVMIISDNNTKLSGRIDTDAFDMAPTFQGLEIMGWDTRKVENGHNLQEVFNSVESAVDSAIANPQKPICLWVKTIKGYGVKSTMDSSSGGHGYPLKGNDGKLVAFVDEIFEGNTPEEIKTWATELEKTTPAKHPAPAEVGSSKREKAQAGFSRAAIRAASEGLPVYSISSDLAGSTGMAAFQKEFPQLSQDVGVAESNMVSMACGLSKHGFIPIVDTFAQFGVTKGNLPLTMAGLSLSPIVCIFSHTGFQDAADGASHQATTYISAVSSIPFTQAIVVSNSTEAEKYLHAGLNWIKDQREAGNPGESLVFFVGRENFPEYWRADAEYEWGKAQVLTEGDDLTIVACGPLVWQAMGAAKILEAQGIKTCVINNPFVNRPDVETIGKALSTGSGKLITMEDHQVVGGMGSLLVHSLKSAGVKFSVKSLGINGEFGRSAYQANQLYQSQRLDAKSVCDLASSWLS